jgi:hypothetical protein
MALTNAEHQAKHRANKREIESKRGHALYRIAQARRELENLESGRFWVPEREKYAEIDAILKEALRALLPDAMWEQVK